MKAAWPTTKSKNPVTILRTVAKAIEQKPKRYNQAATLYRHRENARPDPRVPSCGTIACVAGWTLVVTGRVRSEYGICAQAQGVLGLSHEAAQTLFDGDALLHITDDLLPMEGSRAYVRLGLKHIDQFMRKHFGVPLKPKAKK